MYFCHREMVELKPNRTLVTLSHSQALGSVLVRVSTAMMKHHKLSLGLYILGLCFHPIVQELQQSRSLEVGTAVETTEKYCLLACLRLA